jgi:hypothetical protein
VQWGRRSRGGRLVNRALTMDVIRLCLAESIALNARAGDAHDDPPIDGFTRE